jgi:hypothetical protein
VFGRRLEGRLGCYGWGGGCNYKKIPEAGQHSKCRLPAAMGRVGWDLAAYIHHRVASMINIREPSSNETELEHALGVIQFGSLADASVDTQCVVQKVNFHLSAGGGREISLQIVKNTLFPMGGERVESSCVEQANPNFHFVDFIRRGSGSRFVVHVVEMSLPKFAQIFPNNFYQRREKDRNVHFLGAVWRLPGYFGGEKAPPLLGNEAFNKCVPADLELRRNNRVGSFERVGGA